MSTETITLAGGCFWCLDAAFREVPGVRSSVCGYANGQLDHPSYEQVCSGRTGHAEAVQLSFDPQQVSLARLLEVFFRIHDPTTLNRQGHDLGTQYRSGIYQSDPRHRPVIDAAMAQARADWGADRVVTELEPLRVFWPAEPEHQDYYRQHPGAGYCMAVIRPKVEKVRSLVG